MKALTRSLALLLVSASAQASLCGSDPSPISRNASSSSRVSGHESSGGRPIPMGLTVGFPSLGNGIDTKSFEVVLGYIAENIQNGSIAKVLTKVPGREGERILCLQFHGIQSPFQALEEMQNLICASRDLKKAEPTLSVSLRCNDSEYEIPGLPSATRPERTN